MGVLTKVFGGIKKQEGENGNASIEAFVMKVNRDIFPVAGMGVVVTGVVESGVISSGDKVCFTTKTGKQAACEAEVQAGGKGSGTRQTASPGMAIALLLKGADYRDIENGMVISKDRV